MTTLTPAAARVIPALLEVADRIAAGAPVPIGVDLVLAYLSNGRKPVYVQVRPADLDAWVDALRLPEPTWNGCHATSSAPGAPLAVVCVDRGRAVTR